MNYRVSFDIDLKRNRQKGLYIALEGIDGAGKTTQVRALMEYFKNLGRVVVCTREPRKEGLIGDLIQKVLMGKVRMPSAALQYLFSADRMIHHEEVILPSLKRGDVVISDRCFFSAVVYGILDRTHDSYDYKIADQLLVSQSILSMYHQFTVPDRTFYLRIGIDSAMRRILAKRDKREIYEDRQKLEKLIGGYDWLSERFKNEITVINGEKSSEEVTGEIIQMIQN